MSKRRGILQRTGLILRDGLRSAAPAPAAPPIEAERRDLTLRTFSLRASSYDAATRSVEAVLATESPVAVYDWFIDRFVAEILLMRGLTLPESGQVPLLDTHSRWSIFSQLGSTRGLRVEGNTLVGRNHFDATDEGKRAELKVRDGHVTDCSVGYRVTKATMIEAGKSAVIDGVTYTAPADRGLRVATAWTLIENSLCPVGADPNAKNRAADSAANHKELHMDFAAFLKRLGLDEARLSAEELTAMRSLHASNPEAQASDAMPALMAARKAAPQQADGQRSTVTAPAAPDAISTAVYSAMARREAAEAARVAEIREWGEVARVAAEVVNEAIAQRMSVDDARKHFRKAQVDGRSTVAHAPGVVVRGSASRAVLEAAVCIGHNVGDERRQLAWFGDQTMTEANRYRRLGLCDLARLAGARNGIDIGIGCTPDEGLRSAFSSADLSGILGAVANKALAAAFLAVNAVVPRIAATRSHQNFHAHTVYSLALNGDLQEVGPTGELKHMNLSEENWTAQVKTRGALLAITRTDWVNDSLGAFVQTAQRLGRKTVLARERAMAKLFNATGAGASHFTTANKNYISGAATTLQLSSLGTAIAAMRDQTGPDGDPVSIQPKILLVPTALEADAATLCDPQARLIATALGSTSSAKKEPNSNPWANMLTPVVWEWLSKTIDATAGSSTAWYLLGDPADVPACEIAYLNGNQNPVVEFFGLDAKLDTLGYSWRCYYDFGCNLAEYRAGVKSKGAA